MPHRSNRASIASHFSHPPTTSHFSHQSTINHFTHASTTRPFDHHNFHRGTILNNYAGPPPVTTPSDLPPEPTLNDLYQVNQPSTQGTIIEKVLILQGLCGAVCGILSLVLSISIGASIQIACIIIAVPNFLLSCASSCCGRTNKLFVIKRAMYCTVFGLVLLIFGVITKQYFSVIDACVYGSSTYYGNGAYYGNAAQCMSSAKWYDQNYCNCYIASEDMCVVSRDFTCQEVIDNVPEYANWVEVTGILSFVLAVVVVGMTYFIMPNDLSTPTGSLYYYANAPSYQFPSQSYGPAATSTEMITGGPTGAVVTDSATTAVPIADTLEIVVDKHATLEPIASAPPSMDMYNNNISNNNDNYNNAPYSNTYSSTYTNTFTRTYASDNGNVKPAYVR